MDRRRAAAGGGTKLARQQCDLSALDDDAVLAHLYEAIDHFLAVARLHFEHVEFDLAGGLLVRPAAPRHVSPCGASASASAPRSGSAGLWSSTTPMR